MGRTLAWGRARRSWTERCDLPVRFAERGSGECGVESRVQLTALHCDVAHSSTAINARCTLPVYIPAPLPPTSRNLQTLLGVAAD
jgi:hypothetical protein